MRSVHRRRPVVLLAIALAAVALVVALRLANHGPEQVDGIPTDPSVQADLKEQMQRLSDSAPEGPKVLLPEDQRAPWIASWNRMRDCALRHGFDGVSPVAPTFGDGRTPSPEIRHRPGSESVITACPFDGAGLDKKRIEAAVSNAHL
jgi:hypothetical protein